MASSLPNELCALIAAPLSRKDNASARSVCVRWRAGMPPPPPYRELEHRLNANSEIGPTAWSSDGERVAACVHRSHDVSVFETETASARTPSLLAFTVRDDMVVFGVSFARNGELLLVGVDSVQRRRARVSVFGPDGGPLASFLLNDPEVYPPSLLVTSAAFARDASAVVLTFTSDDDVTPSAFRNRLCWLQLDPASHRPTRVRHVDVRAVVGSDDIFTHLVALSPDGFKLAALSSGFHRRGWRILTVTDMRTGHGRRVFESVTSADIVGFGLLSWDASSEKLALVDNGNALDALNVLDAVFVVELPTSTSPDVIVRHLQNNPHTTIVSCVWSLDRLVISGRPRSLVEPITFLHPMEFPVTVVDSRTGAFVREIHLPRSMRGFERIGWCFKHASPSPDGSAVLGFEGSTWGRHAPGQHAPILRLLNI